MNLGGLMNEVCAVGIYLIGKMNTLSGEAY